MDWLKQNWFKIGLLLAIFIVAFSFWNRNKDISPKEEIINLDSPAPTFSLGNSTTSSGVISQLSIFENFLEDNLVDAGVKCIVLATYNNILITGSMDSQSFQQAFPDSKLTYEDGCKISYLNVVTNQKILTAKPELQSLRILLSSYTNEIKELALYALDGGYQASFIDARDKKIEEIRTLAREEIIRLKTNYNLR